MPQQSRAPATAELLRADPPFRVGTVTVEPSLLRIGHGGSAWQRLEPRVMDVLVLLARHAPQPVTREQLMRAVWGDAVVTDGVLTRCISILRDRLGPEAGGARCIETLSKTGYRLVAPVSPQAAAPPVGADAPALRLAVLPFVPLDTGSAQGPLADGLTELLITRLAGVSSLRVIGRTSSMAYKGKPLRLRDIGAELGVAKLVEGSLHHEGGQLQVSVQLIDAASETLQWTQTLTRPFGEVLGLLNEVAASIAAELSARLLPAEASRLARSAALPEQALQHYLNGRFFWAQRSAAGLRRASEEFGACAAVAPGFAPAHGGAADCQVVLALYGIEEPLRAAQRAREHLARALAVDPGQAEVLAMCGAVRLFFDWDFDAAENALRQALARNPSYTTTYLTWGDLLMMRGEFEAGLRLIREAVALSPLDLGLGMNLGDFLIFSRRFEEAAAQLRGILQRDPTHVPCRLRLAEALALAGEAEAARHEVERAFAEAPAQPRVREIRALVWAASGWARQARDELTALAAERVHRYVPSWELARGWAALGDADAALHWLRCGLHERAPMMLFLGVHAAFDRLRGDPRFDELLSALRIPPTRDTR